MNAYSRAYEDWGRDPAGFWSRAASSLAWFEAPHIAFDPGAGPLRALVPGRHDQRLPQLRRPACRGRPARPAGADLRFARCRAQAQLHLCRRAGRGAGDGLGPARARARQGATGSSSTCRWCPRPSSPCWPAPGSARSHSVVFRRLLGGRARRADRRRRAQARRLGVLRGSKAPRSCPTSRSSTSALARASHKPDACLVLQRPQAEAELTPGRDLSLAPLIEDARAQGHHLPCTPVLATDPLYILYTVRHDGAPERRRARHRRLSRRPRLVDGEPLRHRGRRDLLGRLRHRLGGRPFLHRLRAVAGRLRHRPLRGQAGRHARRRRLLARGGRARRRRPLHRPDGAQRAIKKEDPQATHAGALRAR